MNTRRLSGLRLQKAASHQDRVEVLIPLVLQIVQFHAFSRKTKGLGRTQHESDGHCDYWEILVSLPS